MGKTVTFSDYHLNTKVAFRKLEGAFYKNYMTLIKSGLPSHKSPKSDSTYWHDEKNGLVYRSANHWGEVASCIWDIDEAASTPPTWGIPGCGLFTSPGSFPGLCEATSASVAAK